MLRGHVDDPWLGRGQAARGAMWLRAVYSVVDPLAKPLDVLLRAYDDLPGVERANFFPR